MMTYKWFDETIIKTITSPKDYMVVISIRDMFTYKHTEINIKREIISKQCGVSKPKVTLLLKKMVDNLILMRVDRGIYRLNPFMYLPYKVKGAELQKEWNELTKDKGWEFDKIMGVYLPKKEMR